MNLVVVVDDQPLNLRCIDVIRKDASDSPARFLRCVLELPVLANGRWADVERRELVSDVLAKSPRRGGWACTRARSCVQRSWSIVVPESSSRTPRERGAECCDPQSSSALISRGRSMIRRS